MPPQEKTESGESEPQKQKRHRLLARKYAHGILERALEENEYRSSTMPWSPEEHPSVMAEVRLVQATLFVREAATG